MQPEGWFKLADVNQTARNVFSDLPFEEGLAWIKRFTQHSARSFADPLTKAGYLDPDVRLSYLLCERDVVVPPKVQRAGIEAMEQASGKKVLVTTIEADHSPMMGHLDRVADWIVAVTEPAN